MVVRIAFAVELVGELVVEDVVAALTWLKD